MSLLYGHNKSSKQLLSACVDDNSQFPLLAVHTTDMAIVMEMMSHLPGPCTGPAPDREIACQIKT